jgi:putative acetyltransferase
MELRPYQPQDAQATREVFERAVRMTASRHYSSEQIDAWAPIGIADANLDAWSNARSSVHTVVAVEDDQVVGFTDLVDGALLDMLYVDPSVGGRGVGTALVEAVLSLARERGTDAVETYASLTARALFERHGFVVVEQRSPVVDGVTMTNFRMSRFLG